MASWHRRFGLGLLLAMLLVQQAGLFHRYAHGALGTGSGVAIVQSVSASEASVNEADSLPPHDKTACLLLDQLCVADAGPMWVAGWAAVMPVATLCVLPLRAFLPRWAALFQARGPPVLL
jgi:hypothetical protein